MIEASIKSSDLLYLSLSIYEANYSKGTIIIAPGLNECKERYQDLITYFNNANYNIIIFDPRGHGKSINEENSLGVINDAEKLINDLKVLVNYTQNRFPNLPINLLADSLSALVAINYLAQNEVIKKVVLTSPIFSNAAESNLSMANFMLKILGKNKENSYFQNLLGFNKNTILFKDNNEMAKFKSNPKCFYNYKNLSIYQILRLEDNIKKIKYNPNFKLLIQSGALDNSLSGKNNITDLANILSKKGLKDINYIEYPNMGHKILFDYGKSLVWQDILGFFSN